MSGNAETEEAETGPAGADADGRMSEGARELEAVRQRVARQTADIQTLVETLDDAAFLQRPAEGRWSVGEHVAHLGLTTGPYLPALERALEKGRARGRTAPDGAFRRTWLGRWFVQSMEPPPKRRMKTFRKMAPPAPADLSRVQTMEEFGRVQEELLATLDRAEGLDLGRIRVRSPALWILRFPLIQAVEGLAAHTDRHLWLMRETLDGL